METQKLSIPGLLRWTLRARRGAGASLALALLLSSGCSWGKGDGWKFATWDVRKAVGMGGDEKPAPETPVRLATSWSEATLSRPGEAPKRGFGGRLSFFKKDSQVPVRVDGQLVVYAFDESSADPYKTEPLRRYIFPAEQLAMYESPTALGPSYSIWLPWDDQGGPEQKVSLIVRFEPREGAVIAGEQTKHYLAGPPRPTTAQQQSLVQTELSPGRIQPAVFQAAGERSVVTHAAATEPAAERTAHPGLPTTTIALPRRLSATPGPPLRQAFRSVTQSTEQLAATTEPATSVTHTGEPVASRPATTSARDFTPGGPAVADWRSLTPKGSYVRGPTRPLNPLLVGSQSAPPQAPATPAAR